MNPPQTFRSTTAFMVWIVWVLFAVGNWIDLAVQGRDHASVVAAAILLLATGVAYITALRPRVIVDDAGVTVRNPVRDHQISWAAITDVDLMDLLRLHCTLDPSTGDGAGEERRKVISAWAVHYSRRRQFSADVRARRAAARSAGGSRPSLFGGGFAATARSTSYGTSGAASQNSSEAEAKLAVRLITDRATAARAEALWAASTTDPTPGLPSTPANPAPGATTATATPADAPVTGTTEPPAATTARTLTSKWSNSAIAALLIPALILLIICLL